MKNIQTKEILPGKILQLEESNANLFRIISEQEEKINTLNKLKEENLNFVTLISHEYRTPLSTLSGLLQLAIEDSESERMEKLGMMQEVIKGLHLFTEELGNFLKNKYSEPATEKINWNLVCEQAMTTYRYLAGSDKIKFILNTSGTIPVYLDSLRIKIIINNIISNSIKYRKKNSVLNLHLTLITEPDRTILQISDNGIGISPDETNKIFEMFYRAEKSGQGLGLGLYIVREILDEMDGMVEVQSIPGTGTTMIFTFPVKEKKIVSQKNNSLLN